MNWIKTSGASFKLLRLTNFPRILQNDIRNLYYPNLKYPNLNCGKQLKKNIKFPIKNLLSILQRVKQVLLAKKVSSTKKRRQLKRKSPIKSIVRVKKYLHLLNLTTIANTVDKMSVYK